MCSAPHERYLAVTVKEECFVPRATKFALAHHPTLRHMFIYSNKTWSDVIYRDTLGACREPSRSPRGRSHAPGSDIPAGQ